MTTLNEPYAVTCKGWWKGRDGLWYQTSYRIDGSQEKPIPFIVLPNYNTDQESVRMMRVLWDKDIGFQRIGEWYGVRHNRLPYLGSTPNTAFMATCIALKIPVPDRSVW